MPQEVGENQRYSRVFYMAPNLIRGGCLLVNYRWSIFHFGNPKLGNQVAAHYRLLSHLLLVWLYSAACEITFRTLMW